MENKSGIHPTGCTVLVLLDEVPRSHGMIELPEQAIMQNQLAQIRGTVIEPGPKAWGDLAPIQPGSRVIFRRYAGELVTGADKVMYRIMNDKDIFATFDLIAEQAVRSIAA